jgi:hypothetical protein
MRESTTQRAEGPIPEIANILAAGLMRLLARKSSQIRAFAAENSLDISTGESGHPARCERRTGDD